MFAPFKNDHQSMQVGELIIENQTDKVTIYGDIDVFKTASGLAQAKALQALFTDMVNELSQAVDSSGLDSSLTRSALKDDSINIQTTDNQTTDNQSIDKVDNPFL